MRAVVGLAMLLAVVHGFAHAQPKSDWEIKLEARDWKETEIKPPEYPKAENLLEFEASAANPFRFFVDATSITPGNDGTVRYTLVARSRSGAETVSFNGLRCSANTHKVYAFGRTDKTWAPAMNSDWKELEFKSVNRQHIALMRDFFCPSRVPIMTREEGIAALRQGIHPHAASYQPGEGRR